MSDWIPDLLSRNACQGYYQYDPFNSNIEILQLGTFEEPLEIEAHSISVHQSGLITLHDAVEIKQGHQRLSAHDASLFREHATHHITELEATGQVVLTKPGLRLEGEHLWLDYTKKQVNMGPNAFRWYPRHARGTSQSVILSEDGQLHLTNTTYTTCAPEQDTWLLQSRRVRLDPILGKGHAYHARLLVKQTPILYLPYLQFPLDNRRQSGLLYPSVGTNERSGFVITQPYYFNLSPNYDFLLTPRLRTARGLEAQGAFRYMSYTSRGSVEASILPSDRAFRVFKNTVLTTAPQGLPLGDPRLTALQTHNYRFGLIAHHFSQLANNLTFSGHFNHVHDANHIQDLGNTLSFNDNIHLLQEGALHYQSHSWNAELILQSYETLNSFYGPLNEAIYRRMPMVRAQYTTPWNPEGFEFQSEIDWTHFGFPGKKLDGTRATTGQRMHLRPTIRWSARHPGAFFVPELSVDVSGYDLELGTTAFQLQYPSQIQRLIPLYSINSGLIFERNFQVKKQPWMQTLEPQLFYLWIPYHDQNHIPLFDSGPTTFVMDQLLRANRFTGTDRIGDTKQMSALLTSRWIDNTHWQERLRATIGQIYYFKTRHVSLCDQIALPGCLHLEDPRFDNKHSPVLAEIRYQLNQSWYLQGNVEWYSANLDSAGFRFGYRDPEGTGAAVNVGYSHIINPLPVLPSPNLNGPRPGELEQSEFSIAWPWYDQWQIIGRWHYDWRKHKDLTTTMGLEYSGCCISFQVTFTRQAQLTSLDRPQHYTYAMTAQFGFKGLGTLGNHPSTQLKEEISGYRPLSRSAK